jgi:flagellar basal-body rod protein FlgB
MPRNFVIMDLGRIPLFAALQKRMGWLAERQTVLAENVANADTPNYVAQDLKPADFGTLLGHAGAPLTLVATQPGHLMPRGAAAGAFKTEKVPGERSLDGNGVSLDREMMKVSQTASDYALMTNLYRKHLNLLKTAIGHSGGGG